MRVLVTGAAGFLGQRTARGLMAAGHEVLAFVRPGRRVDLADAGVLEGDLDRRPDLERAMAGADAVVHCGARVRTDGAWAQFEATNVDAVRHLVEIAAGRPLIHVSSLSVYDVRSDGDVVTEESPYETGAGERGFYSRSKLEADRAAMNAAASGAAITVLRPGVLYGPGRRPPLARQSFAAGPLRLILGSPDYLLPLVHVDNVADAIVLALATPGARGRAYTLVDPQVPLRRYVAAYRRAAAATWRPVFVPAALVIPAAGAAAALFRLAGRRPPVTPHQIRRATWSATYDCSRAATELGWRSRIGLEEGLQASLSAGAPGARAALVSSPASE